MRDNLRRLLQLRREMRARRPRIEVQYIKFQHNLEELEPARALCARLGVDQFTHFWGWLGNYTDPALDRVPVGAPRASGMLPLCPWPHFSLLVRYDGGVIPCCNYRVGEQYSGSTERREVGNVFDAGVWSVWNSLAYRELRRLVANPSRSAREPKLAASFCQDCPVLFETASPAKGADEHRWEEFYEQGRARAGIAQTPAASRLTNSSSSPVFNPPACATCRATRRTGV